MVLFLCCLQSGWGQDRQLYGSQDLPQGIMLNPGGRTVMNFHLGMPLLSGMHLRSGSSGVTVGDIFNADSALNFNALVNDVVENLGPNERIFARQKLEILSFGWRSKQDIYFSGGWYQEADAFTFIPKDVVDLVYFGNAPFVGRFFNFSRLNLTAEALSVFHFGINKKVTDKLTLGGRFKVYNSLANASSTRNTGSFVTLDTPQGVNYFSQQIRNLNLELKTSGISGIEASDLVSNAFLSGNLGLGIDLGFNYQINDRWDWSGSIIDLGFVSHSKNIRNFYAEGSYTYNGIQLEFDENASDENLTPYLRILQDDFLESFSYGDRQGNYTTWRPARVYTDLSYGFMRDLDECHCKSAAETTYKMKTGLLLTSVLRPYRPSYSVTGYLEYRVLRGLRTRLTYTADTYSANNIGLLFSATVKNINFYLATPSVLALSDWSTARTGGIQLGFQYILK
ncbi:MAG: DUF5723 family protein [Leeuwenhoekiella sp.]